MSLPHKPSHLFSSQLLPSIHYACTTSPPLLSFHPTVVGTSHTTPPSLSPPLPLLYSLPSLNTGLMTLTNAGGGADVTVKRTANSPKLFFQGNVKVY